jgi:hypothetical protein
MKTALPLALLGCLLASTVLAEDMLTDRLAQTTKLFLDIGKLSTESKNCGLDETMEQQAFTYPVSISNLVILNTLDGFSGLFTIRTTTLRTNNGICFSSVILQLHSFDQYPDLFREKTLLFVDDLLWSDDFVALSTAAEHPQQIRQLIEISSKKFVTRWNSARKSP